MLGDVEKHFWLTRSVARSMGLSLSEEMQRGTLTPEGYSRMVTACRACPLTEACQKWLSDRRTLATTPPEGCANTKVLMGLCRVH